MRYCGANNSPIKRRSKTSSSSFLFAEMISQYTGDSTMIQSVSKTYQARTSTDGSLIVRPNKTPTSLSINSKETNRKKSSRQSSCPSRLKHLSRRKQRQSAHCTHAQCHVRSSTFSRNLSTIGSWHPAHTTAIAAPTSDRPDRKQMAPKYVAHVEVDADTVQPVFTRNYDTGRFSNGRFPRYLPTMLYLLDRC